MAIYKKLLEIQKSINGLSKDSKGYNYDFVSGSKVLGYIKPLMNEQGLLLKQEIVDVVTTPAGEKENLFTVKMRFTWVDVETGETDVNDFASAGCIGKDKGIGGALTYGERYFLLKFFHIATDKDDLDYHEPTPATKVETGENKKELQEKIEKSIEMIQAKYKEFEIDEMLKKLHKKDLKDCNQTELRNIFKGVI